MQDLILTVQKKMETHQDLGVSDGNWLNTDLNLGYLIQG